MNQEESEHNEVDGMKKGVEGDHVSRNEESKRKHLFARPEKSREHKSRVT